MVVAHAHHRFVEIDALLGHVAVFEAFHHVVVHFFAVKVLGTRNIGGERCDAVGQTLLYEVVSQVHIVVLPHGGGHIHWSCPVALGKYLKHHQVALVQRVLAFERDHHAVGNAVGRHHHAAPLDCLLVDGDEEGVSRNEMGVIVRAAYPVFQDVAQFERLFAKCFLSLLRILAVERENLCLVFRMHLNVFVGS